MQEMSGGDNNRTPVIFQGLDIYRFVGAIPLFRGLGKLMILSYIFIFVSSNSLMSCFR